MNQSDASDSVTRRFIWPVESDHYRRTDEQAHSYYRQPTTTFTMTDLPTTKITKKNKLTLGYTFVQQPSEYSRG